MSVTRTLVAPATTWWLVRTSPSELRTTPVPAPWAPSYPIVVTTSTNPGVTAAAAACCAGVSVEPWPGDVGAVPDPDPGWVGAVLGACVGGWSCGWFGAVGTA